MLSFIALTDAYTLQFDSLKRLTLGGLRTAGLLWRLHGLFTTQELLAQERGQCGAAGAAQHAAQDGAEQSPVEAGLRWRAEVQVTLEVALADVHHSLDIVIKGLEEMMMLTRKLNIPRMLELSKRS